MQLSSHFSLEEFTYSETAIRKGIGNTPSQEIINRLILVADKLEKVREIVKDRPIAVSSAYRCLELNRAIGSRDNSAHVLGYAVDFRVIGLSVKTAIMLIEDSNLPYDQLINEYGRWIHISFDPRNRNQCFPIGA